MSLTLVKHDWPGTQGLSWAMAGCPGRIAIRAVAATKQNPATNEPLIASAANLVAPRRTSRAPADERLRRIANARMVSPLVDSWSARRLYSNLAESMTYGSWCGADARASKRR